MALRQTHSVDVTVAQSGTISSVANIRGLSHVALYCPAVTSCQVFVHGGPGVNSLARVWDTDGANEFTWDIAAGSGSIALASVLDGLPFAAVECSVAQAAARVFTLMGRPRS